MRRTITLALSLLGLFDSLYLLYTYTSPSRPMACLGTGCDAVRASAYSTFAGVSMPVFGVAGYALLALAIVAEALFSRRVARLTRYALLGMTGVGFLFSLYLEYLQVFVIHAFCAWCMTSGIVMTALVGLSAVGVLRAEPDPGPALQLAWLRRCFAVAVVCARRRRSRILWAGSALRCHSGGSSRRGAECGGAAAPPWSPRGRQSTGRVNGRRVRRFPVSGLRPRRGRQRARSAHGTQIRFASSSASFPWNAFIRSRRKRRRPPSAPESRASSGRWWKKSTRGRMS